MTLRDVDLSDWVLRFVLHVGTGALAAVTHYVVMALCMGVDVHPVAASGVGFVAGAVVRFVTAFFHVYSPTTSVRVAAPRFALALVGQFAVNALLLSLMIEAGATVWWAQILTTVLLAFVTYLVYRMHVFA